MGMGIRGSWKLESRLRFHVPHSPGPGNAGSHEAARHMSASECIARSRFVGYAESDPHHESKLGDNL